MLIRDVGRVAEVDYSQLLRSTMNNKPTDSSDTNELDEILENLECGVLNLYGEFHEEAHTDKPCLFDHSDKLQLVTSMQSDGTQYDYCMGCYWVDVKAIIATQNTALLNSLIDEEVQLYKIFDDDIKMCVGIKLMADKVREKYDE